MGNSFSKCYLYNLIYIFSSWVFSFRSLRSLQEHLLSHKLTCCSVCSFNTGNSDIREHAYLFTSRFGIWIPEYAQFIHVFWHTTEIWCSFAYQTLEWKGMPWNPPTCEVVRNTVLPNRKGWRKKDEAERKTIKLPF